MAKWKTLKVLLWPQRCCFKQESKLHFLEVFYNGDSFKIITQSAADQPSLLIKDVLTEGCRIFELVEDNFVVADSQGAVYPKGLACNFIKNMSKVEIMLKASKNKKKAIQKKRDEYTDAIEEIDSAVEKHSNSKKEHVTKAKKKKIGSKAEKELELKVEIENTFVGKLLKLVFSIAITVYLTSFLLSFTDINHLSDVTAENRRIFVEKPFKVITKLEVPSNTQGESELIDYETRITLKDVSNIDDIYWWLEEVFSVEIGFFPSDDRKRFFLKNNSKLLGKVRLYNMREKATEFCNIYKQNLHVDKDHYHNFCFEGINEQHTDATNFVDYVGERKHQVDPKKWEEDLKFYNDCEEAGDKAEPECIVFEAFKYKKELGYGQHSMSGLFNSYTIDRGYIFDIPLSETIKYGKMFQIIARYWLNNATRLFNASFTYLEASENDILVGNMFCLN